MMKQLLSSAFILSMIASANAQTTTTDTFATSGTWICPANVTSAILECIGGGGSGGNAQGNTVSGGGGAGGSYAKATIPVTPGTTYDYHVGTGGVANTATHLTGTNGGDSWFLSSTTVMAKGGAAGTSGSATSAGSPNGQGGIDSSAMNIGTTIYKGGNGSNGSILDQYGGGGGGAAGRNAAGDSSMTRIGGSGGNGGGGKGGDGAEAATGAMAGLNPGGGGGGGYSTFFAANFGTNGGDGVIIITYTTAPPFISVNDVKKVNTLEIISVSPNPVNGSRSYLNIAASKKEKITVLITDISGRTVLSLNSKVSQGKNSIELNVSGMNIGTYQISVINASGAKQATRFVKQ